MPRAPKSRRASRGTTATNDEKVLTVTAATETENEMRTDLPFELDIQKAPEDFKPDRSPAGRRRIPSPFESRLPELKGKNWQVQAHDGNVEVTEVTNEDGSVTKKVLIPQGVKNSNARIILRELQKAVRYLNTPEGGSLNLGLDVNVTEEYVGFNVRDKQNRKPRNNGEVADDGEDFEDAADIEDDEDTSGE